VAPGAEPEAPSAPEPTAAHDRVSELATGEEQIIVVPPEPEPQPEPEPEAERGEPAGAHDTPKWRFGRKSR
ncbi:MAG TPA: hypothetical protein VHF27_00035, partial [Acidimicrobiales bacterium]|nr:hypothetical protein [Acidimicrobiales bacterium]